VDVDTVLANMDNLDTWALVSMVVTRTVTDGRTDDGRGGVRDLDAL
jgi:hypothetical protein